MISYVFGIAPTAHGAYLDRVFAAMPSDRAAATPTRAQREQSARDKHARLARLRAAERSTDQRPAAPRSRAERLAIFQSILRTI